MTFIEICKYLENVPTDDPLEKYLFDIKQLIEEDERILDMYLFDVDFLIFYKKLCTVSSDLSYKISVKCPHCGKDIVKRVDMNKDITFRTVDEKVMNGATIELGDNRYEARIPTVRDFMKVFEVYLKFRKVTDLKIIKTISLIKDFDIKANQIERDVLGATHSDITLLLALQDLYFDHVEPVDVVCHACSNNEERRSVTVSVGSLIVDFFRELIINSPIDESKILFK